MFRCMIDESTSPYGPGKCSNWSNCRGHRDCSASGYCYGDSGCPDGCFIEESKNFLGPGKCDWDGDCQGNRHCSNLGTCVGVSGCI
mmetsp:Transcript_6773/g.11379  ORF Transcript_6773/g.11379 Transcript_6773/m.11379 type:complete len:86 (+) Transcript_6773:525-782(+)